MIRQSLIMSLENYSSCDPLVLDTALANLKRNDFHKKLRNELIMLPIPKVNRVTETARGSHFLERAFERVSFHFIDYLITLIYY